MSKRNLVQSSFERGHDDLFTPAGYTADFYNYSGGSYDPDRGEVTGESRSLLTTISVELVPPGIDTTVDVDGTSFDWNTSIRFPQSEVSEGDLIPLGEDNQRPTEVEIVEPQESDKEVFELHGYSIEQGSNMYLCRLIDQ